MSSISIEIPAASQERMTRNLQRLVAFAHLSPSVASEKAYRSFAASAGTQVPGNKRSGLKDTKRFREVKVNPAYPLKKRQKYPNRENPIIKGKAKFLIVVKHQNRADTFIPTNAMGEGTGKRGTPGKGDKRRKIGTRHLLAISWRKAVAVGLGKGSFGPRLPGGVSSRKLLHGKRNLGRGVINPFIQLRHLSVYQLKILPNIGTIAMDRASRGLEWRMKNNMVKDMSKAWTSG